MQVRNLKNTILETEQRNFIKMDHLNKENATLKTQIEYFESPSNAKQKSNMSAALEKVKIEEMESEITMLKHNLNIADEDALKMRNKYEALLADANKTIQTLKTQEPDNVKSIQSKFEKEKVEFTSYIVELETKLEWYVENQEIFNDAQASIERYERTLAELNASFDSKDILKSKRSINDIKKIKALENQIVDLQEAARLSIKPMPDLALILQEKRPSISLEETLKYLKKRIHILEDEKSKITSELEAKCENVFDH